MYSLQEILAAGKKALGIPDAPAPANATPALAPVVVEAKFTEHGGVFDPSEFAFEPRTYRIHFRNGCSGEYDGAVLASHFPFDAAEVIDVRPVEDVGL